MEVVLQTVLAWVGPLVFCAAGFWLHILKSMKQMVGTNFREMPIWEYVRSHPKQNIISALGVLGALAALHEAGQLNLSSAFGAGYMANSLADAVAGRVVKKLQG